MVSLKASNCFWGWEYIVLQVPQRVFLCIHPDIPLIIYQIILYFYPLYIGHMRELFYQHLDHHQMSNIRFCQVVYHHRVVALCYQCWILSSPWTSCNLLLNGLVLHHDLKSLPLNILIWTLLNLIEFRIRKIGRLH